MNDKMNLLLLMNILGDFIDYMYKNNKLNNKKLVTLHAIDKLIYDYA